MKNDELLPCPFCGSSDITACWDDDGGLKIYGVTCKNCPAEMEIGFTSEEQAVKAWNRRALKETPATAHNNGSTPLKNIGGGTKVCDKCGRLPALCVCNGAHA